MMFPCPLGAGFLTFEDPPALGAAGGVAFFGCGASSSEKDSQAVSRTVTGKTRLVNAKSQEIAKKTTPV